VRHALLQGARVARQHATAHGHSLHGAKRVVVQQPGNEG
jgi:hypothetical protein